MIFVSGSVKAQSDSMKPASGKLSLPYYSFQSAKAVPHISINTVVPARFYVENLGFFCKKEMKLETLTGIPFKFRLGSVQYCDRMEGKLNTQLSSAN